MQELSSPSQHQPACQNNGLPGNTVCLPNLFLAGFQQSGSTALYRMLIRHPAIQALRGHPEPHWLHKSLHIRHHHGSARARRFARAYLQKALANASSTHNHYLLDGSRGYFSEPPMSMPHIVRDLCGTRLRVMLAVRHPVARLWSSMRRWCWDRRVTPTKCASIFHEHLRYVVAVLKRGGNCRARKWEHIYKFSSTAEKRIQHSSAGGWRKGLGFDFPNTSFHCMLGSYPIRTVVAELRGVRKSLHLDLLQMFTSGLYAAHFIRWMTAAHPVQVTVVHSRTLRDNPQKVSNCIAKALDIDASGFGAPPWPAGETSGYQGLLPPRNTILLAHRLYKHDWSLFWSLVSRLNVNVC